MRIKSLIVGVVLSLSMIILPISANTQDAIPDTTYEMLYRFGQLFDIIENNHVDGVSAEDLINAAINGMYSVLDPHSRFLTKEEVVRVQESSTGQFFGIGARIRRHEETSGIEIVEVIDGSPAQDSNLQKGDIIMTVNGIDLSSIESLGEAIDHIKGPLGTIAELEIHRSIAEDSSFARDFSLTPNDNLRQILNITVIRGRVRLTTVNAQLLNDEMDEPRIAYLHLTQFVNMSADELRENFVKLQEEQPNITSIILDLRFNGGGLLGEAIQISDMFLDPGFTILSVGKSFEAAEERYLSTSNQLVNSNIPLVILVNQQSASASEIVAGTLQDTERATIIGVTSFGKGSVQQIFPLPDGTATKVTVAKYFISSGRSIHGVGVKPDIRIEISENFEFGSVEDGDPQLNLAKSFLNCVEFSGETVDACVTFSQPAMVDEVE